MGGAIDQGGQAGGAAVGAAREQVLVTAVEAGEIVPCIGQRQGGG